MSAFFGGWGAGVTGGVGVTAAFAAGSAAPLYAALSHYLTLTFASPLLGTLGSTNAGTNAHTCWEMYVLLRVI